MATKLVNVKRPVQFSRPNGENVILQPGLQEVDATPYKGADGKANGPDNAKSDADHWILQQPENAEFPNKDGVRDIEKKAASQPAANGGIDGGTPAAPASGSARGTEATGAGATPATNPEAKK